MKEKMKVVALTGAGISVESGIPIFVGGKWKHYEVMEVTSIDGWRKDSEKVLRFYNDRRKELEGIEPNAAHLILAELEKDFDVTVITQNIDNLHERAGSTKVIHLHGELTKARSSLHPGMIFDIGYRAIEQGEQAPDGSQLRPHVVWFGEQVTMFDAAKSTVAAADILLIIGSGLTVNPAAELIKHVKAKSSVFIINPEKVKYSGHNVTVIREKATVGMEKMREILSSMPVSTHKDGKINMYNVVILDQSGSMQSIKQQAIDGYNETLQTIKAAQRQYAENQYHFVTLVIFNGAATQTVYDRVVCSEAAELTQKTYQPDCDTPLYDAMGTTLTNIRHSLNTSADNKVLITIITDGQENASKKYTGKQIHQMVHELKAMGWVFTYIGADHDVEEAAKRIGVSNILRFDKTQQGTREMFEKERISRNKYYNMVAEERSIEEGEFFD